MKSQSLKHKFTYEWIAIFGYVPVKKDFVAYNRNGIIFQGRVISPRPTYYGNITVDPGVGLTEPFHIVGAAEVISILTSDGKRFANEENKSSEGIFPAGWQIPVGWRIMGPKKQGGETMWSDYPNFNQNGVDTSVNDFWIIFCPVCNNVTLAKDEAAVKTKAEELTEKSGNPHVIFHSKGVCTPTRNVVWS